MKRYVLKWLVVSGSLFLLFYNLLRLMAFINSFSLI